MALRAGSTTGFLVPVFHQYDALARSSQFLNKTALCAGQFAPVLDFDASVAWPAYNWMGVSKAALESINRYMAVHLGPIGARVNLVSAGPLATTAAGGVPGFEHLAESWPNRAPLGWDVHDPLPVARTVCFLLSDWSRGITGEIVYVDGGYRCVGTTVP